MQSHLAIAPPLSPSVHGGPGLGQIAGPFSNFASLSDEIRVVASRVPSPLTLDWRESRMRLPDARNAASLRKRQARVCM